VAARRRYAAVAALLAAKEEPPLLRCAIRNAEEGEMMDARIVAAVVNFILLLWTRSISRPNTQQQKVVSSSTVGELGDER